MAEPTLAAPADDATRSRPRPDFDLACRLLPLLLNPGARPAAELLAALAQQGISERTVRRARKALGVRLRQIRRRWCWALDDADLDRAAASITSNDVPLVVLG